MKKVVFSLCLFSFIMTMVFSNAMAKEDKDSGKQKKDKKSPVQQMSKPAYYQPYNTPANKNKGNKEYYADWGEETDEVKEKKDKKDK